MARATHYYVHSGRMSTGGVVGAAIGTLAAGAVFGAIYGIFSHYNPFIYFTIVANMGLAYAIGIAARRHCTKGHLRNPHMALLLGLLAGCIGVYFNWVFFIYAISAYEFFTFSPLNLVIIILGMSVEGIWSIGDQTPTGFVLLGIWLGEALLFIGTAAFSAFAKVKEETYCETCGHWLTFDPPRASLTEWPELACFEQPAEATRQLEAGDMNPLLVAIAAPASEDCFYGAKLLQCPQCDQLHLLTIRETRFVGKKREKKERTLVDRLIISRENAEALLETIGTPEPEVAAEPAAEPPVEV